MGSSAVFERKYLHDAERSKAGFSFISTCSRKFPQNSQDLFMEFGVYKGDSLNRLADLGPTSSGMDLIRSRGCPEHGRLEHKTRALIVGGLLPPVRKNVSVIKGLFAVSLPGFLSKHAEAKVAFLHIDCDLYSSTKEVFDLLEPMLQPGCVIIFNEYFNYPGWAEHQTRHF